MPITVKGQLVRGPLKTYKISIWKGKLGTRGGRNFLEEYIEVGDTPADALREAHILYYEKHGPRTIAGMDWDNLSATVVDFIAKRVYKFKENPAHEKISDRHVGWKKLSSFKVGRDISRTMLNKSGADVDLKDFTNPRRRRR